MPQFLQTCSSLGAGSCQSSWAARFVPHLLLLRSSSTCPQTATSLLDKTGWSLQKITGRKVVEAKQMMELTVWQLMHSGRWGKYVELAWCLQVDIVWHSWSQNLCGSAPPADQEVLAGRLGKLMELRGFKETLWRSTSRVGGTRQASAPHRTACNVLESAEEGFPRNRGHPWGG